VRRLSWIALVFVVLAASVCVSYLTVPMQNTDATHFDVIVVLGVPANQDGTESVDQKTRVDEGVREFQAGRAAHIIMSGGAAWTPVAEAKVMAAAAVKAGIPAEDVLSEDRSMNTIQNVFYSHHIMQQHGWRSAEVVSSPNHLPRAALILAQYDLKWKMDGGGWPPKITIVEKAGWYVYEALRVSWIRWFGFSKTTYLPSS
jgi:uncharacterized SAM-binding protein YcdF (DUF218 family)